MLQTNSDVVDAIQHFNKTGTISNVVRQASIFRKPYFVGRFLPQLLRPSIDCVLRDQFIDALTRYCMCVHHQVIDDTSNTERI